LALLPTLGKLVVHGRRYVDVANRQVKDLKVLAVHAENFKSYVVAVSRAKGAIEQIEEDAAQDVIKVLFSTLEFGMQSLLKTV
jgi:hypothetical protein